MGGIKKQDDYEKTIRMKYIHAKWEKKGNERKRKPFTYHCHEVVRQQYSPKKPHLLKIS